MGSGLGLGSAGRARPPRRVSRARRRAAARRRQPALSRGSRWSPPPRRAWRPPAWGARARVRVRSRVRVRVRSRVRVRVRVRVSSLLPEALLDCRAALGLARQSMAHHLQLCPQLVRSPLRDDHPARQRLPRLVPQRGHQLCATRVLGVHARLELTQPLPERLHRAWRDAHAAGCARPRRSLDKRCGHDLGSGAKPGELHLQLA